MMASRELLDLGRVCVYTDRETVFLGGTDTVSTSKMQYENDFAEFTVEIWNKGGKTLYKTLHISCKKDIILYDVKFCIPVPKNKTDFVFYKSFIDAPAAAFIRCGDCGFYTGVENPFFTACDENGEIVISYQPSLVLKAGEEYESDPQFIGEYTCDGVLVRGREALNLEAIQSGKMRQRFFNPCDGIALDTAEIKAMRTYVWEYLNVMEREFDNILYFFFYPKKQYPSTDDEITDYLDTIDRFQHIKGDIIAFNPHTKTTLPTEEKPYWELMPQGSVAQKIYDYAVKKGLRCGYYMGCAFNGGGGNAALLPFMPHKTEWKKKDSFGNVASENCLACDEYLSGGIRCRQIPFPCMILDIGHGIRDRVTATTVMPKIMDTYRVKENIRVGEILKSYSQESENAFRAFSCNPFMAERNTVFGDFGIFRSKRYIGSKLFFTEQLCTAILTIIGSMLTELACKICGR